MYIIKSTYENGASSSKVVKKLGTMKELKIAHDDPIAWGKSQVELLNTEYYKGDISVIFSQTKKIDDDFQNSFSGGYLFLQKIYNELDIGGICEQISTKHKFEFDLNQILSRLVFSRILFPASKHATLELSKKFFEQPKFELQHIYRALEIITKETDYIQSRLYANSLNICKRSTGILYFDCTNYFFEIEEADDFRKYGYSKEHRPNPIVQMGLFMDADGIPLAFCMFAGNESEQLQLQPLEKKILADFNLAKIIVCTDAGLSSLANRKFNNAPNRGFITTQSVKKLVGHLKDWALDPKGWSISGCEKTYNISEATDKETVFYKERWINENKFSQRLIVTFSLKYKEYNRKIRDAQIERAKKAMTSGKAETVNQNNHKRFIKKTSVTQDGELASKTFYEIDQNTIAEEEKYDGFYGTCTNISDGVAEIIKVNQRRWEIEECFRIMKSEFKARPVFLKREDRIRAHFMTCFLALVLYRLLEKRLDNKFTYHQIIDGLREMNFTRLPKEGYIPSYTRTDLTNALHEKFGFRTDTQIITQSTLKKIIQSTT